jgi:predicted enzyme involved in methoxymalonyl-ACP biosynthesis
MGFLLCLCSKNNENEVLEVFEARKNDMVLDLAEHIATYRINWDSKVKNMIAIGNELNLHLSSFVFVDDNSGECEHVRQQCPEIAVVQIPLKPKSIQSSLLHSWAFDRPVRLGSVTTDEDKVRTKRYQDSTKRQKAIDDMIQESSNAGNTAKASVGLYSAIIASLAVKVHFEDFVGSHTQDLVHRKMPRLKQLISRTNQFNSSGKKELSTKEILYYVENKEIKDICNPVKDTLKSMALVSATDRFGHYGDVGLLMYSIINTSVASLPIKRARVLILDVFLLSCRALQRGVEYKMLQYIGTVARDKYACDIIRVPFVKTSRNGPAASFLESISRSKYMEASNVYEIHVENAINCLVGCARFKQTVKRDKDNGVIQPQQHNSNATASESFVSFSDNLQMIRICQFSTIKALSDDIYVNQNNNNGMIMSSPFEILMNALEAEGSNPRLRGNIRNEVKDILGEAKFVGDKKRKAATNSSLLNADLNAKQKRAKLERAKYWKRRNGVA